MSNVSHHFHLYDFFIIYFCFLPLTQHLCISDRCTKQLEWNGITRNQSCATPKYFLLNINHSINFLPALARIPAYYSTLQHLLSRHPEPTLIKTTLKRRNYITDLAKRLVSRRNWGKRGYSRPRPYAPISAHVEQFPGGRGSPGSVLTPPELLPLLSLPLSAAKRPHLRLSTSTGRRLCTKHPPGCPPPQARQWPSCKADPIPPPCHPNGGSRTSQALPSRPHPFPFWYGESPLNGSPACRCRSPASGEPRGSLAGAAPHSTTSRLGWGVGEKRGKNSPCFSSSAKEGRGTTRPQQQAASSCQPVRGLWGTEPAPRGSRQRCLLAPGSPKTRRRIAPIGATSGVCRNLPP